MPTDIQKIRIAVADLDPAMPLLDDSSYQYFLDKNENNINRASLDAARTILLLLSQRNTFTIDIFSVTGGPKTAEQYRLSLELFLKSPHLNPVLQSASAYFSNISKSDIASNLSNPDNNVVLPPSYSPEYYNSDSLR